MGLITTIGSKINNKIGDSIAKKSALSPQQLNEVAKKRQDYLLKMPSPDDTVAREMTEKMLAANSIEIFNAYLPQLSALYTPLAKDDFDSEYNTRCFNITKWVTDKKENSIEKLMNVYAVLSDENCNIALIFHRTCKVTEVYLAVTNIENANNNSDADTFAKRLYEAVKGNFPGTGFGKDFVRGIPPFLNNDIPYSVASASNIPALKSEKFVSQTIEKLLDGIVPNNRKEEYTLILLASPINDVEQRKFRLAQIYSGLKPYAAWQTNFTVTEMHTQGSSATVGVNVGASAGIQNGQTTSSSGSSSVSDNKSVANAKSINKSKSKTKSVNGTVEAGVNAGFVKAGGSVSTGTSDTEAVQIAKSVTETLGKTITNTLSKTAGIMSSTSLGMNFGMNFARCANVSAAIGKNEGIVQSFENYNIQHALELLEEQMKRFEQSTAMGMWDFAAYVLSEDRNVANNVAHTYLSLTQGETSYMSSSAVNLWRGDQENSDIYAKTICSYLRELRHPVFGLNPDIVGTENGRDYQVYPTAVTATTSLSGKELAYSLNFPQKSIVGFPVIQCADFGRSISKFDLSRDSGSTIRLGKIFHMLNEENTKVELSADSLASHTFITGSTGAGKSNAVYQILNEASENHIHFLVIEPAKGEYKHIYGDRADVYGTNPTVTPLLKIDPFSFPKEIHILEHLDGLIEIFNVCWPMYAAMPAVLKNALELSYEDCGWNLADSVNPYGEKLYPTFEDVIRNIKKIIDYSDYDAENKGAYKGSLITRLNSLTNGINGMIFCSDELPPEKLFDNDVICDLSRVYSGETKSLIMGILLLKLHEYRSSSGKMHAALNHITVLEEAHHLLKRTSTEQPAEGSNLLGKSVEMLSNSIAEMRTYGEGFIIVDQSPTLLDNSAIKNTNTKIILRLPDESDRVVVGKAASLNDDQIAELSRLPRGVAALYQNEWVQPVLCRISAANIQEHQYQYQCITQSAKQMPSQTKDRLEIAKFVCNGIRFDKNIILTDIRPKLVNMVLPSYIQVLIQKLLEFPPKQANMEYIGQISKYLFPDLYAETKNICKNTSDKHEWTEYIESLLLKKADRKIDDTTRRFIVHGLILSYVYLQLNDINELRDWTERGGLK